MSLSRTVAWYCEWETLWSSSRWRLWVWAFVGAHYWARRPARLWGWWVREYVGMMVTRSRIERRLRAIRDDYRSAPAGG